MTLAVPMDIDQTATEKKSRKRRHSEQMYLPPSVASNKAHEVESVNLKIGRMELGERDTSAAPLRRSSRRRSLSIQINPVAKPPEPPEQTVDDIEKIYLDKTVKRSNLSLETVFEMPVKGKVMSGKKFRRTLAFECSGIQQRKKEQKRSQKMEKLIGRTYLTKKKVSLKMLMSKLANIEDD